MKVNSILLSGGSGLLGTELLKIDTAIKAPLHSEMDITELASLEAAIAKYQPDIFLHAAAFTSPPKINADPIQALRANIIGTANVVAACHKNNIRLVYISTDYVFRGDKGQYKEEDELWPQNKYAWSKLGGECAVRLYDNSLIIRTTFSPEVFPYEKAFSDQFTSRDIVSVIASLILDVTKSTEVGVIHVGTERKTVLELAKRSRPDVGEIKRSEVSFSVPFDTSLDTSKLSNLQQSLPE